MEEEDGCPHHVQLVLLELPFQRLRLWPVRILLKRKVRATLNTRLVYVDMFYCCARKTELRESPKGKLLELVWL